MQNKKIEASTNQIRENLIRLLQSIEAGITEHEEYDIQAGMKEQLKDLQGTGTLQVLQAMLDYSTPAKATKSLSLQGCLYRANDKTLNSLKDHCSQVETLLETMKQEPGKSIPSNQIEQLEQSSNSIRMALDAEYYERIQQYREELETI